MIYTLVILAPILVVALVTDIGYGKIYNWLTFPAMLIGIILQVFMTGMPGGLLGIAGIFVGMACYLPFYVMGGTGAGDVKLMSAVGAFLGPGDVFYAFVYSTFAGGAYAVLLLIYHGLLKETFLRYWSMICTLLIAHKLVYLPPRNPAAMPVLKYGIAIAVGTIGYMLHELS